MKHIVTDQSTLHKPYLYILLAVCLAAAGYTGLTIRYIISRGLIPWMDVVTLVIVWLFLAVIGLTRAEYRLEDKAVVMTVRNPLRTRRVTVPYSAINGVHPFKVQLVKNVFYRYTFRLYSYLDNRTIWSMIFTIPGKDKNARVLMKASETFWEALEAKCPGKIRITQDEAVTNTYIRMNQAEKK